MARKRKTPAQDDQTQLGLGLTPSTGPEVPPTDTETASALDPVTWCGEGVAHNARAMLETLDDYSEDLERLRLLDPPKLVSVIVEACGDDFEVSRLRDNGTTVACVRWTRAELIELQSRIAGALEI